MDLIVSAEYDYLPCLSSSSFPTSCHHLQTGNGTVEKPDTWAGWWGEEWELLQGVPIHVGVSKGGDYRWHWGKRMEKRFCNSLAICEKLR